MEFTRLTTAFYENTARKWHDTLTFTIPYHTMILLWISSRKVAQSCRLVVVRVTAPLTDARAVSPTASQTLQRSAASQHGVGEGETEASADKEILQTDDSGADRVTS